jgi:hypothetical protein
MVLMEVILCKFFTVWLPLNGNSLLLAWIPAIITVLFGTKTNNKKNQQQKKSKKSTTKKIKKNQKKSTTT